MYTILLIAIIPPILIIYYIVKSDKFPEPAHLIVKTFILGVLICFPLGLINTYLIWLPEASIGKDLSFLAGFTEEPFKFLVLYFFIKPQKDFNEPMDAIVYAVIISLGFATFENIEYVFSGESANESIMIGILRAFTAIPLHASCGIIMGYYFGMHVFNEEKLALYKSLIIPISFHAIYNFSTGSLLLMLVTLYFLISFAIKLHKKLSSEQNLKRFEAERKKT
tara:strand:- start:219 stop:887 length:669 start_codon:yes stop_codon:yes gene_type:complete